MLPGKGGAGTLPGRWAAGNRRPGGRSPIIAEGYAGSRMAPARSISICFPTFLDRSAFYRALDFASATRWADFLEAYLGTGRPPEEQ
jgi:hypothetical protein